MSKTTLLAGACLIAVIGAGHSAIRQTVWAAEVTSADPGAKPPASNLTVLECQNLGCKWVEAATCPEVVHDYLKRRWACQCPGGTSCIDESSPH
jgi:hypothetical protein